MEKDNRYYIYDKDSREYDKWYTTDSDLIKEFKKAGIYCNIGNIILALSFISFICMPVLGTTIGAIAGIISCAFMFVCMLCMWPFYTKYKHIYDAALIKYHETDEFKQLKDKYIREEEQEKNKILQKKSKKLVEAYDILDNKELSQEDRIELLKKYID